MSLPTDYQERKNLPIGTGVLDYFPDALAEVSKASVAGNKQHLNGKPLHWDKSKSKDESDAMIRHYFQRYETDTDGVMHAAKMAWRALAFVQRLCDARRERVNEKIPPADIKPSTIVPHQLNSTSYPDFEWYSTRSRELLQSDVLRTPNGQRSTVPTDQADGSTQDITTRHETNPNQRRLRFNGDGDRNG